MLVCACVVGGGGGGGVRHKGVLSISGSLLETLRRGKAGETAAVHDADATAQGLNLLHAVRREHHAHACWYRTRCGLRLAGHCLMCRRCVR